MQLLQQKRLKIGPGSIKNKFLDLVKKLNANIPADTVP